MGDGFNLAALFAAGGRCNEIESATANQRIKLRRAKDLFMSVGDWSVKIREEQRDSAAG